MKILSLTSIKKNNFKIVFFCNLIFVFRPHRVGLAGRRHGASHHAQHTDALDRAHEWGEDHSRPEHNNRIGGFYMQLIFLKM